MRLSIDQIESLPAMAWAASINHEDKVTYVVAGEGVEFGEDWWFEGAWASEYQARDFYSCDVVCGSGGFLTSNCVYLVPPSHTLEAIYWVKIGNNLYASNSCIFLLETISEKPSLQYKHYNWLFDTIRYGLDEFEDRIVTEKGEIFRTVCHPLVSSEGLMATVASAPNPPQFSSFNEYEEFLYDRISQLIRNCTARARRKPFAPLVGLSSGYDSPAVAVIARNLGCTESFTFTQSRAPENVRDLDDSGLPIAKHLGMHAHELDRRLYSELDVDSTKEFLASGFKAEELLYAPLGGAFCRPPFFVRFSWR